MATLDDVAKNEDMVKIANAIRRVTRTDSPMTIPEMPERLLDIRVIEKSLKTVNFNAQGPVSLGTYDTQLKHMFIVMPKANTDVANLAKVEPEIDLQYDNETGELKVAHNEVVNVDVELYVLDLLLPEDDSTAGVIISSSSGSGTLILEYSSSASYGVGDVFIYEGSLGLTLVAHGPEAMNYSHNALLARKFVKQGQQDSLLDLEDVNNALEKQIEGLITDVALLKGQAVRLVYSESDTPTAEQIRQFVLAAGYTDTTKWDNIAVVIRGPLKTNHVWRYFSNTQLWSDTGIDTVSQFTNAIAGVIKGAARDGYVYAEPDGTGSVYGWDALSAKVTVTDEDFDEIYGD